MVFLCLKYSAPVHSSTVMLVKFAATSSTIIEKTIVNTTPYGWSGKIYLQKKQ